ncbi:MAG: MCE family protein [Propionibacteriales bacterium]|nr:MCE family protein [Propionibacteriales bacterium]
MSRRTAGTAALLALLLSGCGFAGMQDLPLPGGPDVGADPLVVTAEFTDVLSLARDATVKYDDVTVGKVAEIGRDGWNARVTLRLRSDLDLPANVTARIAQTSLLGEKYVELAVPGAASGTLVSGATIALASTSRGREVEEVLGALSLLLNGGGIAQLKTITTELDTALGDTEATKTFLRELNGFVGTLDRNRATIISTLGNVDRLAGQIADDRSTVAAALDTITPAVRTLAGQRQELVAMLDHLSDFSQQASTLVRRSGADLVADLKALEPVLAQLQKAGDDLPKVLETVLSFPFPDEVLNAVKGDYVNLDVLVDLTPLRLIGNLVGDDEKLQDLLGEQTAPALPVPSTTPPTSGLGQLLGVVNGLLGGTR